MTPPRQSVGDGYGPGEIVVRKISDEGPQRMAEWHDAAGHLKHLTVAGGTAADASRHAYVYRDGREKPPVLTPRKWTAADVTEEDLAEFTHSVTVMEWRKEAFAGLIAACWNRLEEKYLEDDPNRLLLAQALEALDSVASESQLQLDHPQFPISDKNCDLIRAVMDQLPCKGWSIGGNDAQNLRAMAQYNEDHKPEAIAALEKEVGA